MSKLFDKNMDIIKESLESINEEMFEKLINECIEVEKSGHKIIASGLGKNVPICDKFVGTMLSLSLDAAFMHTNTAVHGDLGMVKKGDLVIILTKSGSTIESVYLYDLLKEREGVSIWLLTFNKDGKITKVIDKYILLNLKHEGDLWNIVPNNSTTINLIVLQTLAIELSKRIGLDLEKNFKPNHPGGAIGESLR